MAWRFGVIGAGVSGLTAAAAIRQRYPSAEVIVWDRRSRIGGAIRSERVLGQVVEGGADALVTTGPRVRAWIRELGLYRQAVAIRADARVPLRWTRSGIVPEPVRTEGTATSFKNGLDALPHALEALLSRPVETGVPVWRVQPRISPAGWGWDVHTSRGIIRVDGLIVAIDAWSAARLLRPLGPAAEDLLAVRYRPRVLVAGVYPQDAVPSSLRTHSGIIVDQDVIPDFRGVSALTAKWGYGASDEYAVIRTFWVSSDHNVARWSNSSLLDHHRDVLSQMGLARDPAAHRIFRWQRAMPETDATLKATLVATRAAWCEEWPSLAVTGPVWHRWGVADCMEDAAAAAHALLDRIAQDSLASFSVSEENGPG